MEIHRTLGRRQTNVPPHPNKSHQQSTSQPVIREVRVVLKRMKLPRETHQAEDQSVQTVQTQGRTEKRTSLF